MDRADRAEGMLLGLACGDALGRPVEFHSAHQIQQQYGTVTEMLGHGTHSQPAGTVTDDTELALCIARSLVEHREFHPEDIAERFIAWYDSGPFDVGMMTADAIGDLKQGHSWREAGQRVWESRSEGQNAGNGSVMRCAPYAIAFHDEPDVLARGSRLSSAITHADPRCTYGCAILNLTLAGILVEQEKPLANALARVGADAPAALREALQPVPTDIDSGELRSSGYVLHTLQTALYHGLSTDTAENGIVTAVNMGEDTDTVGAVTGTIAGARFGSDALPTRWIRQLGCASELRQLAAALVNEEIAMPSELRE